VEPRVFTALAFVIGSLVGSFLNVVIHRLPRGESVVSPGSRCPACGKAIRPWHNVPVLGWLWLRGRCRDCGLPISALDELRMLSNVTEAGHPPLQTILMGQPQLRRMLASPELDQLRQRVLACYHLGGLSRDETHAYVEHRLRGVGWSGWPAWEDPALDLVHRYSGGIPRRINRLCARVLLGGALERADRLTGDMVEATALELEADLGGPPNDVAAELGAVDPDLIDSLVQRVDGLERLAAERERVFGKLAELFAEQSRGRR